MSEIVNAIMQVPNLYKLKKCSLEDVSEAQKKLKLKFSNEYIDYVTNFGVISFYGTEWTGLNVEGYLNVVEATEDERNLHNDFPKDCFVIENLQIEDAVVISDEEGKIYEYFNGTKKLICENLLEYLKKCLLRKQ